MKTGHSYESRGQDHHRSPPNGASSLMRSTTPPQKQPGAQRMPKHECRDHEAMNNRIPALIRLLGSPNDHEALGAARALVRALAENAADLEDLAQAWEQAARQRPPPPRARAPFDMTKVETAVTLYVQGKRQVTVNKVSAAVKDMIAELRAPHDTYMVARYITARLRVLGFRPSRSGNTYTRSEQQ